MVLMTPKVELDMTPVQVVQFTFVLRPRVGDDAGKVSVVVNLRLSYSTPVSRFSD
jgi:hypothetical protein